MHRLLVIILGIFTACQSCQKRKHEPTPITQDTRISYLKEKKEKYCEWGKEHYKAVNGNIDTCDSMLTASLWATACGKVPIEDFFEADGKPHRNTRHDCFPDGASSTISKDMILGFMVYALEHKPKSVLDKFIEYGDRNNWIVGEAATPADTISKCTMSPVIVDELFDIQAKINGEMVIIGVDDNEGLGILNFQEHLEVNHIALRARLYGGITDSEKRRLKRLALEHPDNSLFQFVYRTFDPDHNIDHAIGILNDIKLFPDETLPNSDGRCVENLFMHDKNDSDWLPCPAQDKEFSGIDFVYPVWVL